MIAKFTDKSDYILEVEKREDGVSLFIYQNGEQGVGSELTLPVEDVHELIKYLQEISGFKQNTLLIKN